MSGTIPTIVQRLTGLSQSVGRGSSAVGRAGVNAIRANPVRTAVGVAGLAAVGTGGYLAFSNARDLYSSRSSMAGQFQQEETFPSDLIQENAARNFYMSFKFQAYEKRSINNSPFLRSQGTIRLPIPDGIRDNMSVSYGSTTFTGPEGTAVGAGLEQLTRSNDASGDIGAVQAADIASVAGAAVSGGAVGLATQAAGPGTQAASAYFGIAVNPYQTVLFEKPEFKTHNFSWKFMPRDAAESGAVRNIIRTFQFHMSPGVSDSIGLFFSYPSMVVISLFPSSDFLYRFKPCVIKSVNVNYAASGAPSFFKTTQAPTAITMSVELQEIEYWTNNDFTASAFEDPILRAQRERDRRVAISINPNSQFPGQE